MKPALGDFRADVMAGLSLTPKAVSPKYFYDETGSRLFEDITQLPEYYPTTTEIGILETRASEIATAIGPDAAILEYGSGASVKIRTLLDALEAPAEYVGVDISRDHLIQSAETLAQAYPDIAVGAVCADFGQEIVLPQGRLRAGSRYAGFFPGSTIGNLDTDEAAAFLARARRALGPGAAFVLGADLKKDPAVLRAAYNDAQGVTAAFNRNLLSRMQVELGADLDPDAFEHAAFYNEDAGRVEMHLRAARATKIRIAETVFSFAAGETIHTESSRKFDVDTLEALAVQAGWRVETVWTDPARLFSVSLLRAA